LNLTDQQKIRIGSCAWSFQDWRGAFYLPDLPESRWLEFYANYFPAVEVDSTFHAAPAEDIVRRWVEMTPAPFRFTCKLPRQITHVATVSRRPHEKPHLPSSTDQLTRHHAANETRRTSDQHTHKHLPLERFTEGVKGAGFDSFFPAL